MAHTANIETRFAVEYAKGGNDVLGWDGQLVDRQTGLRHRLRHYELFEEFHGEQTWARSAFPNKAAVRNAGIKLARQIGGAA